MKVLFFGVLADLTGQTEVDPGTVSDSTELNTMLRKRFPKLQVQTYRMAVNRHLVDEMVPLKATDEIALLPPFAGG